MKLRVPAVGLTGRAQHGKDTLAAVLIEQGLERVAFADPLRDLVYAINPLLGVTLRYRDLLDTAGYEKAKRDPEVRRLLQEVGTQARNVLGPDIWVDAAMRKAARLRMRGAAVVFTDVRFPNEAEAIKAMGGILVRVVRPNYDNGVDPMHPSEAQVDDLGHDVTVWNDGTLGELGDKLHAALDFVWDHRKVVVDTALGVQATIDPFASGRTVTS